MTMNEKCPIFAHVACLASFYLPQFVVFTELSSLKGFLTVNLPNLHVEGHVSVHDVGEMLYFYSI